MNLGERQKLILALVIRDYINNAQPVGSKTLVDKYGLPFSPATVRNEMVALTEIGFLHQPHTSAGRVPTEEGYRYFVRQLMGQTDLAAQTKRMITHQFYQAGQDIDHWLRLAASILAHQSQAASIVTAPYPEKARFKHVEMISTIGRQVLMVLVLSGGDIRQQVLTLAEQVAQEILSVTAAQLNQLCSGMGKASIAALIPQMGALEQDILNLIVDEMNRSGALLDGEVYRDGLTNVLAEPEFAEADSARRALKVFEERAFLQDLIASTILTSNVGGVHVLIGGEGNWDELRECSIILSRYGVPGLATGTLGVLGPIRMSYGHSISTVRFVADLLSNLVVELNVG
ncbi:MAG TPA: heat-inducible transcriptional repressor HrcA [Anaerolineales bacterium]|nr:heat-inducible transcriptional repressor HrcA [Anaerolineales bacterium]